MGVTKTLALMRESVDQVRRHVHAADVQLSTAVEALMFDSILDGKEAHVLYHRAPFAYLAGGAARPPTRPHNSKASRA